MDNEALPVVIDWKEGMYIIVYGDQIKTLHARNSVDDFIIHLIIKHKYVTVKDNS